MPQIEINKKLPQMLKAEMARRLATAAILFVNEHQKRLNKSNPYPHNNPSKPGEYPKKRTGFLQKSVTFQPTNLPELERTLSLKLGYDANAFYGAVLEVRMRRLGLVKTLTDMLPKLARVVGTKMGIIK